jgi:hypothetical protein
MPTYKVVAFRGFTMAIRLFILVVAALLFICCIAPAFSQNPLNPVAVPEAGANKQELPRQILRTGINLNATTVSPNTMQLSNLMHLTPLLERIQNLRKHIDSNSETSEQWKERFSLMEAKQQADELISKTDSEIDYAIAEMNAEQQVYNEVLSNFISNRDKVIARTNAAAYITNGALWAAAEALSIPSYHSPHLSVPSGTLGILAGVVPSIASLYTLKAVGGKKETSEVEPNMLAKLFNYPVTGDIEYPRTVWMFLNEVPADQPKGKSRKDQLVDRWIADANIAGFTDRNSQRQLDAITATVAQKKGLSINTLTARTVMLQQLSAEVLKMKRFLLELKSVVIGEKTIL